VTAVVGTQALYRAVALELEALNDLQQVAATRPGNVACMAGPGSGKTRALVARMAHILVSRANQREGAAAITYTRAAAQEVQDRLRVLGYTDSGRTRIGTLHSFCYRDVLLRHAAILGLELAAEAPVLTSEEQSDWERDLEIENGIYGGYGANSAAYQSVRRALATGEEYEHFGPERVAAATEYEARLHRSGRLDAEQMVIDAYRAFRDHPDLVTLLAAKYPYILVDEYQDLGPVLHRIVLLLLEAGVEVFAVGDPDQAIMGFTGADPRYLIELAERDDFARVDLEINYRNGSAIIAASHRILRGARPHRADPARLDTGTVTHVAVDGGQKAHAEATVAAVRRMRAGGMAAADIAVLYPAKGAVLDAVRAALGDAEIAFVWDRSLASSRGPLGEFIQAAARRYLSGPQPGLDDTPVAPTIPDLVQQLAALRKEPLSLHDQRRLMRGMVGLLQPAAAPDQATDRGAADFLNAWVTELGLTSLLSERRAIDDALVDVAALSVGELAGRALVDAVTLTTYASAKGREFKAVIMPGCIEGLMPRYSFGPNYTLVPPGSTELMRARAAFYVAFTRAQNEVVMISGRHWVNRGGYSTGVGYSRFVYDALGAASPYAEPDLP